MLYYEDDMLVSADNVLIIAICLNINRNFPALKTSELKNSFRKSNNPYSL